MASDRPLFEFRGSRDYLHSSTMFDYLLPTDPNPVGIDFAVHKMTSCQCEIRDEEDPAARDGLVATYRSQGMEKFFYELSDAPMTDRYDCNEKAICENAEQSDNSMRFEMPPIAGASYIESAVGVYKHLIQEITPDLQGKLVFARMTLTKTPQSGICRVEHRRAIKGGFFQATLADEQEVLGKLVFGLV